ncbi:MAG: CBS domain-containing protein, partial [Spirochaetaceae bacterium]
VELIRDVLQHKGSHVVSVSRETSVREVLRLMEKENIGAVLVLDEKGHAEGIFSERDYARKMPDCSLSRVDTAVKEVMSSRVKAIAPNNTIEEAMAIMTQGRIRHLPVVENGELLGLVSIGDVVAAMIHEKEYLIEQLEHYITGSY